MENKNKSLFIVHGLSALCWSLLAIMTFFDQGISKLFFLQALCALCWIFLTIRDKMQENKV